VRSVTNHAARGEPRRPEVSSYFVVLVHESGERFLEKAVQGADAGERTAGMFDRLMLSHEEGDGIVDRIWPEYLKQGRVNHQPSACDLRGCPQFAEARSRREKQRDSIFGESEAMDVDGHGLCKLFQPFEQPQSGLCAVAERATEERLAAHRSRQAVKRLVAHWINEITTSIHGTDPEIGERSRESGARHGPSVRERQSTRRLATSRRIAPRCGATMERGVPIGSEGRGAHQRRYQSRQANPATRPVQHLVALMRCRAALVADRRQAAAVVCHDHLVEIATTRTVLNLRQVTGPSRLANRIGQYPPVFARCLSLR